MNNTLASFTVVFLTAAFVLNSLFCGVYIAQEEYTMAVLIGLLALTQGVVANHVKKVQVKNRKN